MTGGSKVSDEAALLFERYGAIVYRRARRLLGTHHDAEEATQEIFLRVLRSADGFEGKSSVTTWLYQITTNFCLNQIRDRRRHRELLAEHGGEAAIQGAVASHPDRLAEVRRLLADADPQQAEAALYVHVDGMSHEEAAEILGVSRRTVGNLLDRFRAWAEEREGELRSATATLPKPALSGSKESEGHD